MLKEKETNTKRHFYIEEVILILLLVLSLFGTRITDYSPVDGYGYWIIMVFVFALLAITIAWLQSKHRITDFKKIEKKTSKIAVWRLRFQLIEAPLSK